MEPDPNFDVAVPAASAAPPTARIVLEARSLKKTYGAGARSLPVLVDANLSLRQGEMVAIVAPSGAGKSTLLHLLAALDTPTSGTVYFATKAIESLLLRGEPFAASLETARKWLAEIGLQDRTEHRAGELSGGEQQRVAIARALVTRPTVLLADEPTGDLDEQNAWAVFELLQRLHRAHQLTSLIATHNLALAARCDRVLTLEHGVLRARSAAAAAMGTPGGEAS